jgi:hypothetical protein
MFLTVFWVLSLQAQSPTAAMLKPVRSEALSASLLIGIKLHRIGNEIKITRIIMLFRLNHLLTRFEYICISQYFVRIKHYYIHKFSGFKQF